MSCAHRSGGLSTEARRSLGRASRFGSFSPLYHKARAPYTWTRAGPANAEMGALHGLRLPYEQRSQTQRALHVRRRVPVVKSRIPGISWNSFRRGMSIINETIPNHTLLKQSSLDCFFFVFLLRMSMTISYRRLRGAERGPNRGILVIMRM